MFCSILQVVNEVTRAGSPPRSPMNGSLSTTPITHTLP